MSDQPLLSDLCSICNINKSKYRCPGCLTRTCSLPCSQRHKQWAQCSGQRDPTKFVKKSQLVTPAGIDHDYNFLASIERDIEKAEKGLKYTTNNNACTKQRGYSAQKAQIHYQHLEASGVSVIRAPKGMSRQKENKSHGKNKKKPTAAINIVWTVEWLDDQKRRELTETPSTSQIVTAQPFSKGEQYKSKKRKLDEHAQSTTTNFYDTETTSEDQNKSLKLEQVIDQGREHTSSQRRPSHCNLREQGIEIHVEAANDPNPGDGGLSTQPLGHEQYGFYLVKPRTSSSKIVLIPLDSQLTLGEALRGRVVLEFPTIYVFPNKTSHLPDDFMLEEEYLKQESEEQKDFNELINELGPEIRRRLHEGDRSTQQRPTREQEVDDKAILDVLKKDFGSL